MSKTMDYILESAGWFLRKNSTVILAVASVAGVAITSYCVAKAAPKAVKKLEEAKEEKGEELTVVETVKTVAPVYAKPVIFGLATSACIIAGAVIDVQKEKTLLGALNMAQQGWSSYREYIIDNCGKEVDQKAMEFTTYKGYCDWHQIGYDSPDQKVWWYEPISGNKMLAYEREIMDAEYHFNRNYTNYGMATLNDLYSMLGMPLTEDGDKLGWTVTDFDFYWIDFTHVRMPEMGRRRWYSCIFYRFSVRT